MGGKIIYRKRNRKKRYRLFRRGIIASVRSCASLLYSPFAKMFKQAVTSVMQPFQAMYQKEECLEAFSKSVWEHQLKTNDKIQATVNARRRLHCCKKETSSYEVQNRTESVEPDQEQNDDECVERFPSTKSQIEDGEKERNELLNRPVEKHAPKGISGLMILLMNDTLLFFITLANFWKKNRNPSNRLLKLENRSNEQAKTSTISQSSHEEKANSNKGQRNSEKNNHIETNISRGGESMKAEKYISDEKTVTSISALLISFVNDVLLLLLLLANAFKQVLKVASHPSGVIRQTNSNLEGIYFRKNQPKHPGKMDMTCIEAEEQKYKEGVEKNESGNKTIEKNIPKGISGLMILIANNTLLLMLTLANFLKKVVNPSDQRPIAEYPSNEQNSSSFLEDHGGKITHYNLKTAAPIKKDDHNVSESPEATLKSIFGNAQRSLTVLSEDNSIKEGLNPPENQNSTSLEQDDEDRSDSDHRNFTNDCDEKTGGGTTGRINNNGRGQRQKSKSQLDANSSIGKIESRDINVEGDFTGSTIMGDSNTGSVFSSTTYSNGENQVKRRSKVSVTNDSCHQNGSLVSPIGDDKAFPAPMQNYNCPANVTNIHGSGRQQNKVVNIQGDHLGTTLLGDDNKGNLSSNTEVLKTRGEIDHGCRKIKAKKPSDQYCQESEPKKEKAASGIVIGNVTKNITGSENNQVINIDGDNCGSIYASGDQDISSKDQAELNDTESGSEIIANQSECAQDNSQPVDVAIGKLNVNQSGTQNATYINGRNVRQHRNRMQENRADNYAGNLLANIFANESHSLKEKEITINQTFVSDEEAKLTISDLKTKLNILKGKRDKKDMEMQPLEKRLKKLEALQNKSSASKGKEEEDITIRPSSIEETEFKLQLSKMQESLEKREGVIANQKTQLDASSKEVNNLLKAVKDVKSDMKEKFLEEVNNLKTQLEVSSDESNSLHIKIDQMLLEKKELEERLKSFQVVQTELFDTKDGMVKREEEIANLQTQLDSSLAEVNKLQTEISKVKLEQNDALENQIENIANLNKQLELSSTEMDKLRAEHNEILSEKKANIEQREKEIANLKVQLDASETEVKSAREEIDLIQTEMKDAFEQQQNDSANLKTQLDASSVEVTNLRIEIEEIRLEKKDMSRNSEKDISNLNAQLESSSADVNNLRTEIHKLELEKKDALEKHENDIANLKLELDASFIEVKKLRAEINNIESEKNDSLEQREKEVVNLQSQLDASSANVNILQTEVSKIELEKTEIIEQREKEIADLKEQLNASSIEANKLRTEIDEIQCENKDALKKKENDIDNLQIQLDASLTEVSKLKTEVDEMQFEKDIIEKQELDGANLKTRQGASFTKLSNLKTLASKIKPKKKETPPMQKPDLGNLQTQVDASSTELERLRTQMKTMQEEKRKEKYVTNLKAQLKASSQEVRSLQTEVDNIKADKKADDAKARKETASVLEACEAETNRLQAEIYKKENDIKVADEKSRREVNALLASFQAERNQMAAEKHRLSTNMQNMDARARQEIANLQQALQTERYRFNAEIHQLREAMRIKELEIHELLQNFDMEGSKLRAELEEAKKK